MHCFYCGAALTPATFFCPECGRRVSDTEGARREASGAPAETTTETGFASTTPRTFVLTAASGTRFEVRGRSLIGRNPVPPEDTVYDAVHVLVDPGKTVSKTHAELLVVAGELVVVDLGSGNGTVVEAPDAAPVRCVPGMPQPAPRGSRLVLGRQVLDVA